MTLFRMLSSEREKGTQLFFHPASAFAYAAGFVG
jgi:hypothetical protein